MTDKLALAPMTTGRPTPAEIEAAALVAARELHAHALDGLVHGRIGALITTGEQARHLVALVGPVVAAAAFKAACAGRVT